MTTSSPGIERHGEGVVDDLLAAVAHQHLVGRVAQPVLALELAADRLAELGEAGDRRVLRPALDDGSHRRDLDVVRSVEVRLSRRQRDHVAAGSRHLHRLGGNDDGGRRLDSAHALCGDGHHKLLKSIRGRRRAAVGGAESSMPERPPSSRIGAAQPIASWPGTPAKRPHPDDHTVRATAIAHRERRCLRGVARVSGRGKAVHCGRANLPPGAVRLRATLAGSGTLSRGITARVRTRACASP